MKVFFLSFWFPYPPDNGARLLEFNFLKALSKKHDVYLISLLQPDSDPKNVDVLEKYCRVVSLHPMRGSHRSLAALFAPFARRPRSIVTRFDQELFAKVQQSIRVIRPDVIVVSMVDLAEYVTFGQPGVPRLLIDHNCEFGVIQRMAHLATSLPTRLRYEMSWRKYAAWEARILRQFNLVVMPSEEDKQKMQQFSPRVENIRVIPNAADTDLYDPACWSPEPYTLVYNGALTYGPNLDAVLYYKEKIYPGLKKIYPNIQLLVTGRYTGVDVSSLLDCPGIKLTGYVEDMRDVLYRSAACIVPLHQGGGMRLKIPEAMAAGVPVVSTRFGAEGLEGEHGKHLLIADTAEDFVNAITRVLEDKMLVQTLRQNARHLVETKYSWKRSAGLFVELVESIKPTANYADA